MTRPSERVLESRLDEVEQRNDPSDDGFHIIQIGGNPDKGGWYAWTADKGVYENSSGYEIPPADAPESEFELEFITP